MVYINKEKPDENKTDGVVYSTSGLKENTAAVLAYLGVCFSGLVFLLYEKESEFVRFHAIQSTLVFLPLLILAMIFNYVPDGFTVQMVIVGIAMISWLLLMIQAFRKKYFKLPLIGQITEKIHARTK